MTAFNLDNDVNLLSLKQPDINTLTKVQPHGVLLILQESDLTVLQVSTNTRIAFGLPPEEVLGKTLDDLLDSYQVDQFRAGLHYDNLDIMNPTKVWVRRRGDDYAVYDAIFHRNEQGFLIMELEPALTQENIPFLSFYHLARASIGQLESSTTNLADFCSVIVHEVRQVTGFDRVMLYKFDDDGHGEVLAEEKARRHGILPGAALPRVGCAPARPQDVSVELDSRHPQRPCRPGGPDPRHQSRHPSAHGSGHVHPAAALPLPHRVPAPHEGGRVPHHFVDEGQQAVGADRLPPQDRQVCALRTAQGLRVPGTGDLCRNFHPGGRSGPDLPAEAGQHPECSGGSDVAGKTTSSMAWCAAIPTCWIWWGRRGPPFASVASGLPSGARRRKKN